MLNDAWLQEWLKSREPPPSDSTAEVDAVREFIEERAAILEYDAGLPRESAELQALREAQSRFGPNWSRDTPRK